MRVLKCDICGKDDIKDSDDLIQLMDIEKSEGIQDVCRDCNQKIITMNENLMQEAKKAVGAKVKVFIQKMASEAAVGE